VPPVAEAPVEARVRRHTKVALEEVARAHDRRQELRHDTCWQGYQRLHDFIYAVDTYQTVNGLERSMH
jgi:hypothetical protein